MRVEAERTSVGEWSPLGSSVSVEQVWGIDLWTSRGGSRHAFGVPMRSIFGRPSTKWEPRRGAC